MYFLNLISQIIGSLAHIQLPQPFNRWLIQWFIRTYQIDTQAIRDPIDSFPSLGKFFTRDLKPSVRPIEGALVYPVDGTLRNAALIDNGVLEQVKGKTYTLEKFFDDETLPKDFMGGLYYNMYLSPRDYHHVHVPVTGTIQKLIHIPGTLFPVNDWTISNINNVFCQNERLLFFIDSQFGPVVLIMVGALNVGSMTITFDELQTNQVRYREKLVKEWSINPPKLSVGDRLGTFHLGSSVVLCLSREVVERCIVSIPSTPTQIQFGEKI